MHLSTSRGTVWSESALFHRREPKHHALADPVTAGGVTTGQAAGMQLTSGGTDPTGNHAVVWSYTINSNGTMTSQTALDLQTSLPAGHNLGDAMDFSGSLSSQALAINDSGQVVVGAPRTRYSAVPRSIRTISSTI